MKTHLKRARFHCVQPPAKFRLAIAAILALYPAGQCIAGSVVTDGSVGRAGTIAGPNYLINSGLGKTVGPNLFHSFSTFSLDRGETASFSGPTNISNVISRITGGSPSLIDGTLQCTIPKANFYLINSAGVVFGPDAALDVKGSFVVTTADYLKFSDGVKYAANGGSQTPVLTSAAPSAFGFLSPTPAGISVQGSTLIAQPSTAVSLIGGNIQIVNGAIVAPGGRVNLVSAASAGELTLDASGLLANIDLSGSPVSLGDVDLSGGFIVTSGDGGGRVSIRAGTLEMNYSEILANNTGATSGRGVDIALSGDATLTPAVVSTNATGSGSAGPVSVSAGNVVIDGSAVPSISTGITTVTTGSSAAGNIALNVASLQLTGGSVIGAGSQGSGPAGNISIVAKGLVQVDAYNFPNTAIRAKAFGTGDGGTITLTAGSVNLTNGGTLDVGTGGRGNAGNISISTGPLALDNVGGANPSGILADSISSTSSPTGHAGQISVQADAISLGEGASISASTNSAAAGGSISVKTNLLTINPGLSTIKTGLFVDTYGVSGGGSAGTINIQASTIQVTNGGLIDAESYGDGNAGSIDIAVSKSLVVDDRDMLLFTGIYATAYSGAGGNITVTGGTISVLGGASISAGGYSTGPAGTVTVNTSQSLTVNQTDPAGFVSNITAENSDGPGGTVRINGGDCSFLNLAFVSASTYGIGSGGTVDINARTIAMENTVGLRSLVLSTAYGTGSPGAVNVSAQTLTLGYGSQISAANTAGFGTGTVNVNANTLTLDGAGGHAVIDAISYGSGPAGHVNVNAGSLQLINGGSIAADTHGSGAAGTIMVTASTMLLNGQVSNYATGVFAQSSVTSAGGSAVGAAGTVTVNAGSLQILNGASIASNSQGPGTGGTANVNVSQALTIDGGMSTLFTGINADSRGPGTAGGVNVTAGSLTIAHNAQISSNALSTGSAGNVSVSSGSINLITGGEIASVTEAGGAGGMINVSVTGALSIVASGKLNNITGITADSNSIGAGGDGGNISVSAGSINIQSGGQISSDTYGLGVGGKIAVSVAGPLVIDGSNNAVPGSGTGITADSFNSTTGGNAGNLSVSANSISLSNGGSIDSSTYNNGVGGNLLVNSPMIHVATSGIIESGTFGSGAGGNVVINGTQLIVDGLNGTAFTGITAQTQAAGIAGSVTIHEHAISVSNAAEISSSSFGSGKGGAITLVADSLTLSSRGQVDSASQASGQAGSISITLTGDLSIQHSQIATLADHSDGGDIQIAAANLTMRRSAIVTEALEAHAGGNISIRCRDTISLLNSSMLTQAGTGPGSTANGGNMLIDPTFVILRNSRLSANGGNNGGNISVRPDNLLVSQSPITATGMRGVSGALQISPDYNLAGALVSLPTTLSDNLALSPTCAADLPGDVSSFIVTGRGGVPLTPAGWVPDLELRLPPNVTGR